MDLKLTGVQHLVAERRNITKIMNGARKTEQQERQRTSPGAKRMLINHVGINSAKRASGE